MRKLIRFNDIRPNQTASERDKYIGLCVVYNVYVWISEPVISGITWKTKWFKVLRLCPTHSLSVAPPLKAIIDMTISI